MSGKGRPHYAAQRFNETPQRSYYLLAKFLAYLGVRNTIYIRESRCIYVGADNEEGEAARVVPCPAIAVHAYFSSR